MSWASEPPPIILNGEQLTIEEVVEVARFGKKIEISPDVRDRIGRSHKLLLSGAKFNLAIYGLNRGVGLNKDRQIFKGNAIDPEVRELSEQFNRNMIYSHSTAFGADSSSEIVRAAMLIRLNTLLRGVSGIQPKAIDLLAEFLNRKINPIIPCKGSVGEADIAILSHIALAMIGGGEVIYDNKRMPAEEALKLAHLEPLRPFAKDALSILSSNAYSVGLATLTLHDISRVLDHMNLVFAMSLEGLNGNVAPFLAQVQKVRPFCSQCRIAKKVRTILEGSYLWTKDETRALQDPLSFRTATQVHGVISLK